MTLQLVIGNKNYSSWSMRAWLALRCFDFDFEETRVPLFSDGYKARLAELSSAARVPILIEHGVDETKVVVHDSLAICEYLAERNKGMWPEGRADRARARSVSAEMHASFFHIRDLLPLNCRQRRTLDSIPNSLQTDIDRVFLIWRECLHASTGPFLFGQLSIADMMYAPVISRFATYQISIPSDLHNYINAIETLAPYQEWQAEAALERETIATVDQLSGESLL